MARDNGDGIQEGGDLGSRVSGVYPTSPAIEDMMPMPDQLTEQLDEIAQSDISVETEPQTGYAQQGQENVGLGAVSPAAINELQKDNEFKGDAEDYAARVQDLEKESQQLGTDSPAPTRIDALKQLIYTCKAKQMREFESEINEEVGRRKAEHKRKIEEANNVMGLKKVYRGTRAWLGIPVKLNLSAEPAIDMEELFDTVREREAKTAIAQKTGLEAELAHYDLLRTTAQTTVDKAEAILATYVRLGEQGVTKINVLNTKIIDRKKDMQKHSEAKARDPTNETVRRLYSQAEADVQKLESEITTMQRARKEVEKKVYKLDQECENEYKRDLKGYTAVASEVEEVVAFLDRRIKGATKVGGFGGKNVISLTRTIQKISEAKGSGNRLGKTNKPDRELVEGAFRIMTQKKDSSGLYDEGLDADVFDGYNENSTDKYRAAYERVKSRVG